MADYTKYPNQIDTSTELPKATDLITPINSEFVNRLREAILAVENELGIQPSGTNSTVRARLDYLDSKIGTGEGGGGNVEITFEAVKLALAQADSPIGFNDSSLTDISRVGTSDKPFRISGGGAFDFGDGLEDPSYIVADSGAIYVSTRNEAEEFSEILIAPSAINITSSVGEIDIIASAGDVIIDMGDGRSVNIASTSLNIASNIEIGQDGVGVINFWSTELNWNGSPLSGGGSGSRIEFDNNFMDTAEGSVIFSPDFVNIYSTEDVEDGIPASVNLSINPGEFTLNATTPDGEGGDISASLSLVSEGFEAVVGGNSLKIDSGENIFILTSNGVADIILDARAGGSRLDLQDDRILSTLKSIPRFALIAVDTISTTNATPTNFASISVAGVARPAVFDIYVSARTASSAAIATWVIQSTIVVRGGTAVFVSSAVTNVAPTTSDAALSTARVSATATGASSIRVSVTGVAATNITWSCMIRQNIP